MNMKKINLFLAVSALAVLPLSAQQPQKAPTPEQQYQTLKKQADGLARTKKESEAFAVYRQAAEIPGLSSARRLEALMKEPEAKFRSNFPNSGFASYTDNGIREAMAMYRKLLADKSFGAMEKVELHKRIADCLLELMMVDEANAMLKDGIAAAGKDADAQVKALYNTAHAYARELNPEKAVEFYRKALSVKDAKNAPQRFECARKLAALIEAKQGKAAVLKELEKFAGIEYIINQYKVSGGSDAEKVKTLKAVIADKTRKDQERANAVRDILRIAMANGDIALIKETFPAADSFIKQDSKKFEYIYTNTIVTNNFRLRVFKNPADLMFIGKKALTVRPGDETANSNIIEYLIGQKDIPALKKALSAALTQPKLEKNQKFLTYQAVAESGNAKAVAAKIRTVMADKPAKEQAKNLQTAAQMAWRLGKVDLAKDIWAERTAMLVPEDKRSIPCPFVENGPETIDEFLAKNPAKTFGILDRKYGDNLQFLLETDATITGRNITEDKDPSAQPTRFTANCDTNGLKLFFIMPCAPERSANLKLGYGGFGGYEMYLATGYDMPYYCMLIDGPPANQVIQFDTQYNNRNFRQLKEKAGDFRCSFKVGKDCVYMLLEVSWAAVLDQIPVNGTKWEFEPIHWERGGWSWGGSKSVHNRSSFGLLVFENMTEANRTLIKRALLPNAQRAYNKELNARNGGLLEHWADPELGDPEFNQKVIVPFMEKYGAYARMIKADMTDAEVNKIFDEAYDTLINTKYIVQSLRSAYLQEQMTEE